MKNPKAVKWLVAAPVVASTGLLTLVAAPASAASNPFEFPEQCNYFPAPTNILACFSQSGDISQSTTSSGSTVTRASVTTTSVVYDGPTRTGTQIARSKTTQISNAAAAHGQPAVFHLRQRINARNFANGLSCVFHIQLEIVGDQVWNVRTDIKCK